MKSIDYLSTLSNIDDERIGMVGLSYGGFYTLMTAAIDTRIKAAIVCCQYGARMHYSWPDWAWRNSAFSIMDNEQVLLVAPRHLCIELADEDKTFHLDLMKQEYDKLLRSVGPLAWLDMRVFEGSHEFYRGDEDIDKLVAYLFEEVPIIGED